MGHAVNLDLLKIDERNYKLKHNMKFRIIVLIALALLPMRCVKPTAVSGSGSTTTDNAKVTGSVYYANGLPAAGAAVRIRPSHYARAIGTEPDSVIRHDTTVNSAGRFFIDSLRIGEYFVEINDQKSEASLLTCKIQTAKDSLSFPNDTLQPYTSVSGKVDSSYLGKGPLYVQVTGLSRLSRVDSATGAYGISDLPPGAYTLRIIAADSSIKPVVIDSVKTDTVAVGSIEAGPWMQTNGPFGTHVADLAVDKGAVFAATVYGGLFRSTNRGVTWDTVNNGLHPVDPQSTGIYVTTVAGYGTYMFAGTINSGLFRSSDLGATWSACNNGLGTGNNIRSVFPFGSILFIVTDAGIFRSIDNGNTWLGSNTIVGNAVPIPEMGSLITLPDHKFLFGNNGNNNGFNRSSDSGVTWKLFDPPDFDTTTGSRFTVMTSFGNILYILSPDSAYRSIDDGATWTPAPWGLAQISIQSFAATPGVKSIFALTPQGIFRSHDTGATWTETDNGVTEKNITAFAIDSSTTGAPNLYAGTYDNGIFLSVDDGNTWTEINNGLRNTLIKSLGVGLDGKTIFAGFDNYMFRSTDYGNRWVSPSGSITGLGMVAFAADPQANFLYVGSPRGVFRSSDSGMTWAAVNTGLPDTVITSLVWTKNGLFAGLISYGIYRSMNNGASWSSVNNGLSVAAFKTLSVDTAETGTARLYACFDDGIFQSVDNGASWSVFQTGLLTKGISCMGVYPRGPGQTVIFVGGATSGVIFSLDKGESWQLVSSKQLLNNICAFAAAPNGKGGSVVFGASVYSVYQTLDNGATWSSISTGLPRNDDIFSLAVGQSEKGRKYLYAGTNSFGVWRVPLK